MNKTLLYPEVQQYISENIYTDTVALSLRKSPFEGIAMHEITRQIDARKKSEKKLPSWFSTPGIYYPSKLSIEQTSSEKTARYKASLTGGDSLIDLTGGFGVDCRFFARQFNQVFHCEVNEELSAIATHNFRLLGIANITTVPGNGIDYIRASGKQFDWIYIDPSRRSDSKGKVFMLADCIPDVPFHLDMLFTHADNILIKTSPILDISNGIRELCDVREIHIVAVNNEVKELLWILEKEYTGDCQIKTVNLNDPHTEKFNFRREAKTGAHVSYSPPLNYLYEPNAAIMKSGGFRSLSEKTGLSKLHQHTHLYTSEDCFPDFPGRTFRILKIMDYNKKAIKKELGAGQANITTRNFPESVATIRKKFGIKDGGDRYVFFTTDRNDTKTVLICAKSNVIL